MRLRPASLVLAVALFAAAVSFASAQEPAPALPGAQPLDSVALLELPPTQPDKLRAAEAAARTPDAPLQMAVPAAVTVSPASHGTWETLPDGSLLWRLRIRSAGALNLNLGFTHYVMPDGGTLTVSTPDGRLHAGPYTSADNESHGQLWTPPLSGDEQVVAVSLPTAARDQLQLALSQVSLGFRDPIDPLTAAEKQSGACNVDVVCPDGNAWRQQIRSVARILIGGTGLCSGALVNNTAQDGRPYFLTANHCGVTAANAATVVSFWNYDNPSCRATGTPGNGGAGTGSLASTLTGAVFRAAHAPSDFTLIELDDPLPFSYQTFFAGWDRSGANATSAVAIHHPRGEEKRISFENNATTTAAVPGGVPGSGTHIRVIDWDLGTTERGSSGSPLFDQNQRVIGQLAGGAAACGNNSSDYYGRLVTSWTGGGTDATRLSNWLDPGGTGAVTVDGRETGDSTPPDTTIISGPPSFTPLTVAAFAFSGSDGVGSGVAGFECRLDGGPFAPCASPQSYAGLADGAHTFQVRARDLVGNLDPTPAVYSWSVDTAPPDTTITATPPAISGSPSASFSFGGADGGSGVAGFECSLDGGPFAPCASPQSYAGLADGAHTFQVRARDLVGNLDPTPAAYTWSVDTAPPDTTITSGPPPISLITSASFSFSGDDGAGSGVASFECSLDGAPFAPCASPQNYAGLADGAHTFQVRALDAASNPDPTPAAYIWAIATTCAGATPTISGTAGNDTLVGTEGTDIIFGLDGADRIDGRGGDDLICGGPGADQVRGGAGDDIAEGGDGGDLLEGLDGADTLRGDAGTDTVRGGDGRDALAGGDGEDRLFGDAGDDALRGGDGSDALDGGEGDDTLDGDAGDDTLVGGDGGDALVDSAGRNTLRGGAGDDTLAGGPEADRLRGDAGNDSLVGGAGDDDLDGGADDDTLDGGDGADLLVGSDGADTLTGGAAADRLRGGPGADTATDFTPADGDVADGIETGT